MNRSGLVKYIAVGGAAYICEISTLLVLTRIFKFSGFKAVAVSFWVGFVVAFVLQKLITFQNYDNSAPEVGKQLGLYSLLVGWNYGFTLLAVNALQSLAPVLVIRTFVILIVTFWNYYLYKHIFRQKAPVPSTPDKS